ncbi:MAG: bifunctional nuclease domain-containing protein [Fidelibacterota bacterium]
MSTQDYVTVKVDRISFHTPSRSYAAVLKEVTGDRLLPVIIGAFEAQSIALALEYMETPRPLTHDLIGSIIQSFHYKLSGVKITDLVDGVFYARMEIQGRETEQKEIDARPSDAIAVALRLSAPIVVSEKVMEEAGMVETEKSKPEDLKPSVPPLEILEEKLKEAVNQENYERAAEIRDRIKELYSN